MIMIYQLDSKKECQNYDYTTTGETTEDESEVELRKRKQKKRASSEFKLGNYTTAYMHRYNLFLSVFFLL